MGTGESGMNTAFESWFFASKYAQVVIPSDGDIWRAWDAWKAACEWQLKQIDEAKEPG